jgi:Fe(3+) dicitrate transport protein
MELVNQDMTLQNFAGAAMTETNNSKFDKQPLFGLGLAYDLGSETAVYANVSQSYRATTFGQSLIPVAGGTANDAAPSVGWHYELGMRGTPRPWITWDSALFLVDLDNKFGTAGTALTSVGRSINYGWDGALQFDVIGAMDAANGTHRGDHLGALNLYANASIMEARLTGGANNGGTPQFAPPYMVRTGVIYSRKSKLKIAFLGTLMARHSASDTAVASFDIPAYTTWDLTAEIPVTKHLTLIGGLNNVFDKQYYARVNAGGIDPAYGRNFYVGGSVSF